MPETFLLLFAGGVMLAAAISNPHEVTLLWLRLAGIIALCLAGVAIVFYEFAASASPVSVTYHRIQISLIVLTVIAVLGQIAFVQIAWRRTQRVFAMSAFVLATLAGANVLHGMMIPLGSATRLSPKPWAIVLQTYSCAGIAALSGLALMDMLLGHAYLTASKMTMRPFARLNRVLSASMILRGIIAIAGVLILQYFHPWKQLWGVQGLYMITRWLVGLAVPLIFVFMAQDCIKRRSTQSATGILYVAGILIFIGEIVALSLVRDTGLPF